MSKALCIRPWGWHDTLTDVRGHKVKHIHVSGGKRISLQSHRQRSEHWLVVYGVAHVTIEGREFELQVGQSCDVAVSELHRLSNYGRDPLGVIEVQIGEHLSEDDIERFEDDYGRVEIKKIISLVNM